MFKPLHELGQIHYGKSPSEAQSEDGEYPIVGTGGIYGKADHALFTGQTIVVPRKGTLGNPQFFDEPIWPADTTYAITMMPGVKGLWLYYQLLNFDLTKLNEATGVPSISREWLYKIEFDDPGNVQQGKIADILKIADEAIAATKAIIAKCQRIRNGLMHDLFARGVAEDGEFRPPRDQAPDLYEETPIGYLPKEWNCLPLSECCKELITYGIVQAGPHIEDGVPYIRTGDMAGDKLEIDCLLRTTRLIAKSYRRSEVRAGEIVCAIRATVGKALRVPPELDGANLTQGTARISPGNTFDPSFLLWSIRSERVQRSINGCIKGTTFSEITLSELRELTVAVPKDLKEQNEIGQRLEQHEIYLKEEMELLRKLKLVKSGLMHDLLTVKIQVKTDTEAGEPVHV